MDVEATFQCGLCLARLEHVKEAKPYFEKVLQMDKEHADAYYNLGVAYVFEENKEKALALFKKSNENPARSLFSWEWYSFVRTRK